MARQQPSVDELLSLTRSWMMDLDPTQTQSLSAGTDVDFATNDAFLDNIGQMSANPPASFGMSQGSLKRPCPDDCLQTASQPSQKRISSEPSRVEGLCDSAVVVCETWFKNYETFPNDKHINALSCLTGADEAAIRQWFARLTKTGLSSSDSAYQSRSSFLDTGNNYSLNPGYSSDSFLSNKSFDLINDWNAQSTQTTNLDLGFPSVSGQPLSTTPSSGTTQPQKKLCQPTEDQSLLCRDETKIYQCTRKCGKRYGRKSEWKRKEEEAYPSRYWSCSLCASREVAVKPCYRKYHFVQHFRNVHPQIDPEDYEALSRFENDAEFPRRCGFCPTTFSSRRERVDHIADHFVAGKCMLDWSDEDTQQPQVDENDDDDDDDGHNGQDDSGPGPQGDHDFDGHAPSEDNKGDEFDDNQNNGHGAAGGSSWDFEQDLFGGSQSWLGNYACSTEPGDSEPKMPVPLKPTKGKPQTSNSDTIDFGLSLFPSFPHQRRYWKSAPSIWGSLHQEVGEIWIADTAATPEPSLHLHSFRFNPEAMQIVIQFFNDLDQANDSRMQPPRMNRVVSEEFANLHFDQADIINAKLGQEDVWFSDLLASDEYGWSFAYILSTMLAEIPQKYFQRILQEQSCRRNPDTEKLLMSWPEMPMTNSSTPEMDAAGCIFRTEVLRILGPSAFCQIVRGTHRDAVAPPRAISWQRRLCRHEGRLFRSIGLLGIGASSTVDEVIHVSSGLKLARKTYKNTQYTVKELGILRRLLFEHAHIVSLFGLTVLHDQPALLLYPSAETNLRQWMIESRQNHADVDGSDLLRMFGCLVSALQYLHEAKDTKLPIVHCDLKPENILLFAEGEDYKFVICDFGSAQILHDPEGPGQRFLGHTTLRYQAPELHAKREITTKTDIWSLGCIIVETLVWLMAGEEEVERFKDEFESKAFFEDAASLKGFLERASDQLLLQQDGDWVQVIQHMLSVDPEKRPLSKDLGKAFPPRSCCVYCGSWGKGGKGAGDMRDEGKDDAFAKFSTHVASSWTNGFHASEAMT